MAQKLAPAEKDSTDISAASAAFCISEINQFTTMFSTFAASLVVSVLSRASTRNFLLCMRPPGISRLEIVAAARLMFTQGIVETAEDWEVFPQHSGNICFLWLEPFTSPMCLFLI